MARPRKPPSNHARLPQWAKAELQLLVNDLYTEKDFKTDGSDLLAALILAARRLPLDVVQALIPAYIERERAELEKASEEAEKAG